VSPTLEPVMFYPVILNLGPSAGSRSAGQEEPMSVDDEWVRAPRQARSQATLERFVEATRQLLEQESFEDITVADIVARAERTVGSFYARFDDKYAVLHVLTDRLQQRVVDVVRAFCDPVRWEGVPVSEFVVESIRLNVQAYRRAGPLYKASLQASATDERFRRRRTETMLVSAEEQKKLLLSRVDELGCADPRRASDMMFELVSATLDHELLFGRFTVTYPESDAELVDQLTDQSFHILGIAPVTDQAPTRAPEITQV
jgi:AcrR family transcriptional regulator